MLYTAGFRQKYEILILTWKNNKLLRFIIAVNSRKKKSKVPTNF